MKNQRRNEIMVGFTVLAGIVILLFGFAEFKEWQLSSSRYTLRVRFTTASGLEVNDPVFLNGIKVGEVDAITFEQRSIIVELAISNEYRIPTDSRVSIQMLELMGGKKVDITQGLATTMLESGAEVKGAVEPDISGALSFVGSLEGDVRGITGNANRILDHVNGIVGDPAVIAGIKESAENLRVLSRDLRSMVTENRGSVKTITGTVDRLSRRVDSLLVTLTPGVEQGLRTANSALTRGDSLLASVQTLVTEIRESRGLVHTVLHDTTLTARIDKMLAKTDSLASIIINGDFKVRIRL